jgi:hypothetical protein
MRNFTIFDGYSDTGETHFDNFVASREYAAQILRKARREGCYIERRPHGYYYIEPNI